MQRKLRSIVLALLLAVLPLGWLTSAAIAQSQPASSTAADRLAEIDRLLEAGTFGLGSHRLEVQVKVHEDILQILRELGDRPREVGTLYTIANLYWQNGQFAPALSNFQQALSTYRSLDAQSSEARGLAVNGLGIVETLNYIGTLYRLLGQSEQALAAYQQALSVASEPNDRFTTLSNIGRFYRISGDAEQAMQFYQQALSSVEATDEQQRKVAALNDVGELYQMLEQPDQALRVYQQALTLIREGDDLSNSDGQIRTFNNVGELYRSQGDQQATVYFQQASSVLQDDPIIRSDVLQSIGDSYLSQGEFERASAYFQQAVSVTRAANGFWETSLLQTIAQSYLRQGQPEQALAFYQQALAAVRANDDDRAGEIRMLQVIENFYVTQGQPDRALIAYQQAQSLASDSGDRSGEAQILEAIAEFHLQAKPEQALAAYQQALAIYQQLGDRYGEARMLEEIGLFYESIEQPDQALAFYQQALSAVRETDDQYLEGAMLSRIADFYEEQGQTEQARQYREQAETVQNRAN